jgi:cysteine-rich repeat protein
MTTRWITVGLLGLAALGAARPALAHGGRLPLEAWGGFGGELLRCQRVIARAGAQCASGAWAARRACRESILAGGMCDEAATAARIAAVRRAAQDQVDAACSERQAIDLQFLGSFDLHQDLVTFCRDWETAADSAAFGAAGAGPCATAAAAAASDVLQYALRSRRHCMDRVAASAPGDGSRAAMLGSAARHLAGAVDRAAARLAARCPDFTARSGRSPRAFVATLAARADCIGGAFYIQDAVLCAAPVCGNGVVEPNEECDDGNTADGDACPAGCVR